MTQLNNPLFAWSTRPTEWWWSQQNWSSCLTLVSVFGVSHFNIHAYHVIYLSIHSNSGPPVFLTYVTKVKKCWIQMGSIGDCKVCWTTCWYVERLRLNESSGVTLKMEDTLFETSFTEFKKPKGTVKNGQTINFFSCFKNCASWIDCKNMTAINPIGNPKVGQKHSENISQATCSYLKTWGKNCHLIKCAMITQTTSIHTTLKPITITTVSR